MDLYNQFLAIEPIMKQGLEDLKTNKDAFNAILPSPLAAIVNPKHIISGTLQTLKSSAVKLMDAGLGIASVSDYICCELRVD